LSREEPLTAEADAWAFLDKAAESLASAQSDFAAGRYNSCGNRSYYACYQAAVAALISAGLIRMDPDGRNQHGLVQALFAGQLINRRKLYGAELRSALPDILRIRVDADYRPGGVGRTRASRALRESERFVDAVTSMQGGR
jgi:uncharacterized protein (UPF0332 family)